MQTGAAFSTAFRTSVLDWLTGTTFTAAPANIWVGLFSTAPADGGGSGVELTGSNYARVQVTPDMTAAAAAAGGGLQKSNNAAKNFPAASANWLQAVAFGIFTASSGGTPVMNGALTTPITVLSGQAKGFDVGDLILIVS